MHSALARGESRAAWFFISPWLIGFLIFTAGPMLASLVLSFSDYQLIQAPNLVGTANYQELFQDPKIAKALLNTFVYALIFVPTGSVVALGLALMLYRVGRGAGFFRTAFYLPVMTPAVAASAMFLLLLNGQRGLVNQVLGWVGIQGPNWTTDPAWLKPSIAMVSLWSVGGSVVIYLAALKNVPRQLYEAAELDGAGPVARFVRITLPMISGALFFTIITHTIAALQMFDQAYTMFYGPQQKETASEESLVYLVYLFQNAFQYFRMGYASAMAWVLFLIILTITLIQLRLGKRYVYYESERD
ncbi:carbohydrate ABC transporter permease [Kribbella sp. CA-293567]|uniref:carbohydrate ABC transporter permease n=1 Tax=Kribbella sp. CA-293567 TaxID=3002436 RepID=UPI0022DD726F|nr:sugar ABC transporter permease [Kribbella sp. CA-293567]WBQ03492.1 sugar ABC transporter permease [Kribbella sp. CA-293567]